MLLVIFTSILICWNLFLFCSWLAATISKPMLEAAPLLVTSLTLNIWFVLMMSAFIVKLCHDGTKVCYYAMVSFDLRYQLLTTAIVLVMTWFLMWIRY